VDRLAALKQINVEEMGKATTENAIRLFHLPPFTGSS
jgi:Tat protein secretion system quality control protein TatD with DNase activity